MDQIVRLLVDAARIAAGALETYPNQTDLDDLLASIAETQARDPDHPPIEWRGDPGPYFVDASRLKTAILAFMESLAWWSDDGPVIVAAAREDKRLHLSLMRRGSQIDAGDSTDPSLGASNRSGGEKAVAHDWAADVGV